MGIVAEDEDLDKAASKDNRILGNEQLHGQQQWMHQGTFSKTYTLPMNLEAI